MTIAKFQYSFCSYSTRERVFTISILEGFQYSFCSYSTTGSFELATTSKLFQYSFCSYSTSSRVFRKEKSYQFQYSFCSYSTDGEEIICAFEDLFQYSFCSYSTQRWRFVRLRRKKFQYSFCSYSTVDRDGAVDRIVSIQLLFLFNKQDPDWKEDKNSFNTASVFIQPEATTKGANEAMFQYSFCFYSTVPSGKIEVDNPKFQYSFCFYST